MNDVLNDALSNLEHDNYERSHKGYENRLADVALIRAALAAQPADPSHPKQARAADQAVYDSMAQAYRAGQPAASAEPSDEELARLWRQVSGRETLRPDSVAMTFARALLSRYGRPAGDAQPVAWTTPDGREPISDAVKQARPDLYAKHHTRPLVFADRQQPKTYRDSADFHSNASTAELAAWQRGWNDCREADRQQRGGDVNERAALEKVLLFATQIRRKLDSAEVSQSSASGIGHDACERAIWIQDIARAALAATKGESNG